MIKLDLQLFGGRGASSSGSGGSSSSSESSSSSDTFKSAEEFEKEVGDNYSDPRVQEFQESYEEEADYNKGLEKNLNRAIDEDGYDKVKDTIKAEKESTKKELDKLPKEKTPSQLGTEMGLNERLDMLNKITGRKGDKGKGRGDVDITG